jgi:NitT/TauT family transport system ATP-binding protein
LGRIEPASSALLDEIDSFLVRPEGVIMLKPSLVSVVPERAREQPIIELRGITKAFAAHGRQIVVFRDLSFSIAAGSFLSVVGPSGCGKSTLLRLISGLDRPTSGEVMFRGEATTGPPKGAIYVFQQYTKSIFPWRTVIQNVAFGIASQGSLPRHVVRRKCLDYIRLVGLESYENYFPSQLSGGMQQRVAIARALICEPAVLLMDEPFSAVDAMTRAILQELILDIRAKMPVTVVFVTHDVEEAVFLSSHIVSLGRNAGGIKEDLMVPLPYPRDQIKTREHPEFLALRQKLFSSIFAQEKAGTLPSQQHPPGSEP